MRHKKHYFTSLLALSSLFVITACGRSNVNQLNYPGITSGSAYSSTLPATQSQAGAYSYPTPQNLTQNATAQPVQGGRAVATANGYVYQQDPAASANGYSFYNAQNPCLFSQAGQSVQCNGTSSYYGQQPTAQQTQTGAYNPGYASAYPATNTAQYPGSTPQYPATYGGTTSPTQTNPYSTGTTYGSNTAAYSQQRAVPTQRVAPLPRATQPQQTNTAPVPQATSSAAASRLAPTGTNTATNAQSSNTGSKPKVSF